MGQNLKKQIVCISVLALCANGAGFAYQQECKQVVSTHKQRYVAKKVEQDGVVKQIEYGYRDIPIVETICTPVKIKNTSVTVQNEQYYAPHKAKTIINGKVVPNANNSP